MAIVLNGTSGITNDSGYTGDGVSFADSTPANTLVTTSGGNVGIGTSSPEERLTATATNPTDGRVMSLRNNGASGLTGTKLWFNQNTVDNWNIGQPAGVNAFVFCNSTGSANERMRIDSSGNLLVGTTSSVGSFAARLEVLGSSGGGRPINTKVDISTSANQISFNNTNGQVGSISTNGSATAYNTSSDYRLKHDIQPMTGALAKVAALKPVTYKWNVDGSDGEGFIAHELAEVVPGCVTGEKDAVDAEGKPVYQGIDTSFLVATLTAAIQEQQALINAQQAALESLTARVVALEGQAT